jgi:hypothetical protein
MRTGTLYTANRISLEKAQADIWGASRITERWHIQSVTPTTAVNFEDINAIYNDPVGGGFLLPRVGFPYVPPTGSGLTWEESCLVRSIDWAKAGLGLVATITYTTRYFETKAGTARGLAADKDNLTDATTLSNPQLLLGCMMMPTIRTRAIKAYRIDGSSALTAPDPAVDRSVADIGGIQVVTEIDVRQINYKLRMYIDADSISTRDVATFAGAYVGHRNSDTFFGNAPNTMICDGVAINHLEGEYWELVIDYLYDEYSFHSQEPALAPDGKPLVITGKYSDVRWVREKRSALAFNDIWPVGDLGKSLKFQAWKGSWY